MKFDPVIPTIAQHYQDVVPSDSAEFNESETRATATISRIEAMRFAAAVKGLWLNFSARKALEDEEAQRKFVYIEIPPKDDIPKLKRIDGRFGEGLKLIRENAIETKPEPVQGTSEGMVPEA